PGGPPAGPAAWSPTPPARPGRRPARAAMRSMSAISGTAAAPPFAGITQGRFKGSRPIASSQPPRGGSPVVRTLPTGGRATLAAGMGALENFFEAVRTFGSAVGSVDFAALGIALALHLGNLLLRTRGWRSIVAASYPHTKVRWRWTFGAYCAGVGINGIAPGRLGDAVKLVLLRR